MGVDLNNFDWANNTFVVLNDTDNSRGADKWAPFSTSQTQFFSIPPTLLTQAAIGRHGQITPPEELSPAEPLRDSAFRQGSIPVEQLQNEVPWPMDQPFQSLVELKLSEPQQHSTDQYSKGPFKRRRISEDTASANQNQVVPHSPQQSGPKQQLKRKRGRPKAQPQTIRAYTQDGIPFMTSTRQNHLEKNRVAARKCRQHKKVYIEGLEERARIFSAKNKALKENVAILRDEVLSLKNEVLRHAGCGVWAVDEYLARCASDLLGMGFQRPASLPQAEPDTECNS